MSAIDCLYGSPILHTLCIAAILILVWAIGMFIRTIREKRSHGLIIFSMFIMCSSFAVFEILMDCSFYFIARNGNDRYIRLQYLLFSRPWLFYAGMELLCAALLMYIVTEKLTYDKKHLTADTIRQAVNYLPEGIAIGRTNGTVLLANLKMEELYRNMTGAVLADVRDLPEQIRKNAMGGEEQQIVSMEDGTVWQFEDEAVTLDGEDYIQIIAGDVTERYLIIKELKDKNAHLTDIRRRMKAVSDLSADMFIAEEQQKARAALHNQLGQVLLMGRYFLDHRDSTDPGLVYTVTTQMNRFLLGEAPADNPASTDVVAAAVAMAGSIGVTVHFEGDEPADEKIREILAAAISECAANTVKHADGDSISVSFHHDGAAFGHPEHTSGQLELASGHSELASGHPERSEGSSPAAALLIDITNNGKPPKRPVAESGGLLSLRKKVEAMGGEMLIDSIPEFKLTIAFP